MSSITTSTIQSVLQETRLFHPSDDFVAKANVSGMQGYKDLCQQAKQDYVGFWAGLAREHLSWYQDFNQVLNDTLAPFYRWFENGLLNASYNCLDRQVANGNAEKTAIIFESDEGYSTSITYQALLQLVCQLANGLKSLGLQTGDCVVIYMPMSIQGVAAMQACARLGVTHSVVFAGFSAKSLHERIVDIGAVAIITADQQMRGGKNLPLKAIVDEALRMGGCSAVKKTVVYQRTGAAIPMVPDRDIFWDDLILGQSTQCSPVMVESEHPLFVLYTSGSTGKPKGVQHSTAGYLLWVLLTMKWTFDIQANDIFWCTADIGWITGHSYVAYGPLAVGATQVIFEGVPTYPNAGRFWNIIARQRVSIFYTAPTAIRSLIKAAELDCTVHPAVFNLSSLRLLGSVGEPINPEAWVWYYQQVGRSRCPVVDTFWQTETGGHMIAPLPGATPLVPGSCTLPLPGIEAAVVDETGKELPNGQGGLLVIKKPWPSMIRNIWGDPQRFKSSYFPDELGGQLYLAGDGAVRHQDNAYFTIMGRIDDVLNVSGHRLGTMEIESALVANPLVAEAAVVGRSDEVSGEAIVAFVVLKQVRPSGQLAQTIAYELRNWVVKEIGPIAKPKDIRFGDNLPKTRSGKIMRRLLRSIAMGQSVTQDISTLENPAILKQLAENN